MHWAHNKGCTCTENGVTTNYSGLSHSLNLCTIKTDIHKCNRLFLSDIYSFRVSDHSYDSLFISNALELRGKNVILFTAMALYPFKPLYLGSATEQSAGRVVARRPESRALSRMRCVVDSVTRPVRDGSDGCCYLTTASLAGCGSQQQQQELKYLHGLQTHLMFVSSG